MSFLKISSRQIDYVLVFLMVVMSVGVSFLGATIFRLFLLGVVLVILFFRGKPLNLRNFRYILLFYILWVASLAIYFNLDFIESGQLLTYLSFFVLIIACYYAIVALDDFFKTYVRVVYHLAIISFFFYTLQQINLDLLIDILRSFDPINSVFKEDLSRPSIVIYTYAEGSGLSFRNYGFATEPGEFSVFLIVALMLHVTMNNFKLDRIAIVLIVAVLTTLSTAGYLGLLVFVGYMFLNKKFTFNKIWFAVFAIPAIFLILRQGFVVEKISQAWARETVVYDQAYLERITPGRIGSFMLDIEDFKENPIIGYGIHYSTRYINYGGIEQQRTNGVSDYLVKFGAIGFLIMLYNFYNTLKRVPSIRDRRSIYIIILAIMVVSFAQVVLATPLFLALQFYHFRK